VLCAGGTRILKVDWILEPIKVSKSPPAGPAGDDVAHEEFTLGDGLGVSESNRDSGLPEFWCGPGVQASSVRVKITVAFISAIGYRECVMLVSGWSNSTPGNHTGAGYGVRISYDDRDRYFQRDWNSVEVALDNGEVAEVSLSEKFWTTGPELKSSAIGRWMLDRGIIPRAKGRPPQFDLEPIGDRRFRLAPE